MVRAQPVFIFLPRVAMARVAGLEPQQALSLFAVGGRCVGLRWLGHSKHAGDTIGLTWFRLRSLTSSSMVLLVMLGMPNWRLQPEESRESLVGDCAMLS
jgi:hypothetical protein